MSSTEQYISLLEHTNQQLSLSWTPMSTFIAALGVLFAAGAIVAGFLLYRQSLEYKTKLAVDRDQYKKRFEDFFTAQEEALKKQKVLLDERNAQVQEVKVKLDQLINKYEERSKTASQEHSNEIQKAIEDLEKTKATLNTTIGGPTLYPASSVLGGEYIWLNKKIHCATCNAEFTYNPGSANILKIGTETVFCPNGHMNVV